MLILSFFYTFPIDISKLVPLSFVADTIDYGSFEPEASGLLMHEYFDKIYKMYPNIKSYKQLQNEEILHIDPLKDSLNPYNKENSHLGHFKDYLESMLESDEDKKKKDQKNIKFKLDTEEVKEYLRPTIPPFSAVNKPNEENKEKEEENKEDEYDEDYEDLPDFIKDL